MKPADVHLVVVGIVFLFFTVLFLLIYFEVVAKDPSTFEQVDIILISKGRNRVKEQYTLWQKNWSPQASLHFVIVHLAGSHAEDDFQAANIQHVNTDLTTERDVFLNLISLIPNRENESFMWASDNVVPIKPTTYDYFKKNKVGWRFFNGFNLDALLFGVANSFEDTIPCTLFSYKTLFTKHTFQTYKDFQLYFVLGKHNLYSNIAQIVLLSDTITTAKTPLDTESFQVVHVDPTSTNKHDLNAKVLEVWRSYIV